MSKNVSSNLKGETSDLPSNSLVFSLVRNKGRGIQNGYVDIDRVRLNVHIGLPIGREG